MLRYYDLYACPDSRTAKLVHLVKRHTRKAIRIRQHWVFHIELAFHRDPLKCPWGGYMEFSDIYVSFSTAHPPPDVLNMLSIFDNGGTTMTTTYLVDGNPMTEAAFAQRLRERYLNNPPEGYTSDEISRMKDDDILDMDYFLHE